MVIKSLVAPGPAVCTRPRGKRPGLHAHEGANMHAQVNGQFLVCCVCVAVYTLPSKKASISTLWLCAVDRLRLARSTCASSAHSMHFQFVLHCRLAALRVAVMSNGMRLLERRWDSLLIWQVIGGGQTILFTSRRSFWRARLSLVASLPVFFLNCLIIQSMTRRSKS